MLCRKKRRLVLLLKQLLRRRGNGKQRLHVVRLMLRVKHFVPRWRPNVLQQFKQVSLSLKQSQNQSQNMR